MFASVCRYDGGESERYGGGKQRGEHAGRLGAGHHGHQRHGGRRRLHHETWVHRPGGGMRDKAQKMNLNNPVSKQNKLVHRLDKKGISGC